MVDAPPPPPPPFLPPDDVIRERLDGQQVRIQVVLFITFLIFTMILILGRLRSRGNSMMKRVSTNSFMITAYLVSFIPGLMTAPGQSNDLYVFWVAFIAYLAAVTNEISCYTLGDNEDRKKRLIIDYAVVWPLILTSLYKSLAAPEIIVPIIIIFWVVVLKLRERSRALMFATTSSNGLSRAAKIIADFDKYKKGPSEMMSNSNPDFSDSLVGLREAQKMVAKKSKIDFHPFNSRVITLDKVLDKTEAFLTNTAAGKQLQDTCISFSMFTLLLAKIAGYDKVDFKMFKVANNKLPKNAFDLVEKELGFLYDYLFTNYYAIYERGFWKKFRDIIVISLFFWLTLPLLVEYRAQDHNILYVLLWERVLDTGFTRFVILAILVIEFVQIGIFLTSKWAKVMYTCAYLQNQTPWGSTKLKKSNLFRKLITLACLMPRPRLTWCCSKRYSNIKMGQYSILKCYDKIPNSMWFKCWIGSYFDLPRMGQDGSKHKELPLELKNSIVKAVETSLHLHKGQFSNGVCSLEENAVEVSTITTFVKKVPSQARVILIWHIATGLLELDNDKISQNSSNYNDYIAATMMSNYCAYLLAFFPQMLPDHVYTTQCVFDQAVKELEMELVENDDIENSTGGLNVDDSILEEAENLKKKLEEQPNLWRTLAEFWMEMLLFAALSDHDAAMEAHANTLCIGGEFITHLWALLTHAGCSKKLYAIDNLESNISAA